MEWEGALPGVASEVNLSRLPFSIEKFSVLGFFGNEVKWLKNEPSSVRVGLKQNALSEASLSDSFQRLSNKMSRPGFELEIPEGVALERPVLCLMLTGPSSSWKTFSHRIKLAKSASASVIFAPGFDNDRNSLTSHLISGELEVGSDLKFAHLNSVELSENSYAHIHFIQKKESRLECVDLGYGVNLGRTEIHVDLNEAYATAHVSGIHLCRDSQVYDTRVKMMHHSADTTSRQNFKCAVADKAHSLFGGFIFIEKDAQRVDSAQSHKALILSKGAKASAFPELEVHADDVKAGHGSSTGQMDPDQIFYLKSRGLTEKESVRLLSEAFVNDVILKQSDANIRSFLEELLGRILPQFVGQMEAKWMEAE